MPEGVKRQMRGRPAPADETDDGDDEPMTRPSRRARGDSSERERVDLTGIVSSGRKGAKEMKKGMGDYPDRFQPDEDAVIVKFLSSEPVASWRQHWLESIRQGQKSFTCLGDDCPLCANGDKPSYKEAYNVVSFADPEKPVLQTWTVGIRISRRLEKLNDDPKRGPLDDPSIYYVVDKTGDAKKDGGGSVQVNISSTKARNLEEEYDIVPLTKDELEEFEAKAWPMEKVVNVTPKRRLQEIADEYIS